MLDVGTIVAEAPFDMPSTAAVREAAAVADAADFSADDTRNSQTEFKGRDAK